MRYLLLAVLILAAADRGHATEATEKCRFLLEGIRTLPAMFTTKERPTAAELYESVDRTLAALIGLARDSGSTNPYLTATKISQMLGPMLLHFRSDIETPKREGASEEANIDAVWANRTADRVKKAADQAKKDADRAHALSTDVRSYEDLVHSHTYIRRFSPRQQYYSVLFVAYAMIRTKLLPTQQLRVVDYGAGYGDSTAPLQEFLPLAQVSALDIAELPLKFMNMAFPDIHTLHHDMRERLPFEDHSIDYSQAYGSAALFLNHDEFAKHLREVKRTLKPGAYHMFEVGPRTYESRGPSLSGVLDEVRAQGLEPEARIGVRIEKEPNVYVYPILVRSPL